MSAVLLKNSVQSSKLQTIHVASIIVQGNNYSNKPYIIKNPTTASLKRGTGGRSSFNGVVCTIFGNTGMVGRYLCNRLGKIGTQLILPHRSDFYFSRRLKLCGDLGQVLFHPFHLQDEESIYKSLKYSNVVVNLIGKDWPTNNFSYNDVHVKGARRIAKIAKKAGVERLIHVSSLNVSPNPKPLVLEKGSQFLKSKWEGECAVKEEFPEATIIRPSIIYGTEDKFFSYYSNKWNQFNLNPVLWKMGEETEKQPVHGSDVAAGIVAIILDNNTAGKTYQFVGPRRYKLRSLVEWIQRSITTEWEKDGSKILNLNESLLFKWRVTLNEMIGDTNRIGNLHWEGIEKDSTSDVVLKELPTLEDLGIEFADLETVGAWDLRLYHRETYYDKSLEEYYRTILPPECLPI